MSDLSTLLARQRANMRAYEHVTTLKERMIEMERARREFAPLQLSQYPRLSWLAWGSYQQPMAKGRAA